MQQQTINNQRPTKGSSIYLIIGVAFIFSQTIITLFWLFLSFIGQTFIFVFNLCATIYATFQNYYLTIIAILTLFLLQKFRIKMDKFLGSILQRLMDPSFKCEICNQRGDCDANCKRCKVTYHIECFKKNDIQEKCTNPSCNQQLYKQKCIDIIMFVRNNKKYATYVAIFFALIGLYPSARDLQRYFSSLFDL